MNSLKVFIALWKKVIKHYIAIKNTSTLSLI